MNKKTQYQPERETAVGQTALVLAGGGMTGIAYELGALHALDCSLVDFNVNDFDIYVGTSAGATLSALLANGFSPGMILHAVQGNHDKTRPFERQDLWSMDIGRFLRAGSRIPRRLWRAGQRYVRDLRDSGLFGSLWVLMDLLPSSLYDGAGLEAYLQEFITNLGGSNAFDDLEKELNIIATRLDTGRRVVFNRESNVRISQAVAASSAVPGLYKPVELNGAVYVDGAVRGNASLDVAVERGATTVICINPVVPFDGRTPSPSENNSESDRFAIGEASMQTIMAQAMRTRMHAGLHYHIKHLSAVYPDVDFYLIEPDKDDPVMSVPNLMRYGDRFEIARHAFVTVSRQLAQDRAAWQAAWRRHQVQVRPEPSEAALAALAEEWPPAAADRRPKAAAQLSEALTRLDDALDPPQEAVPLTSS
ncbi:MAG: patatin-like phospholipase family protein [Anaerolineaceae bacterium]|nr:patatin-like phospholipase family protein [Anaerolineaceae bacterium]